jgi:hypothetical protein
MAQPMLIPPAETKCGHNPQAALRVERQMAAESAEKAAFFEDECEQLRQRLTHLSTVGHLSGALGLLMDLTFERDLCRFCPVACEGRV